MYINGKINTDPSNILKELERFYCKLYASGHNVPGSDQKRSSFLGELNVPKLSEEQKINCEGKISSKTHICVNLGFFSGISNCEGQNFDMAKSQLTLFDCFTALV